MWNEPNKHKPTTTSEVISRANDGGWDSEPNATHKVQSTLSISQSIVELSWKENERHCMRWRQRNYIYVFKCILPHKLCTRTGSVCVRCLFLWRCHIKFYRIIHYHSSKAQMCIANARSDARFVWHKTQINCIWLKRWVKRRFRYI